MTRAFNDIRESDMVAATKLRGVDPATTDRVYTEGETEFIMAVDEYKRVSGRPYPSLSELYGVMQGLGYRKGGGVEVKEFFTPVFPVFA